MPNKFRIAEAAEHLGVSTKTLRRWESSGKLLSKRSKGGHRYYTQAILDSFNISNSKISSEPRPAEAPFPAAQSVPEFFPAEAIPSLFTPASKISAFRIVLLSLFGSLLFSGTVLGASSVLTYGSLKLPIKPYLSTISSTQKSQVLAEETVLDSYSFNVNIPANFAETAVFAKDITAPNIITGIEAENLDVTISGGIATLENTAQTFKTIKVGSTTFDAGSINDILELAAGGSSTISIDTTNKKVTISSSSPDYTLSGWTIATGSVYLSTTTNNVGIGTTSPTSRLHVVGTSDLAGDVILGTAASDDITVLGAISAGSSIIPSVDLGADLGSALKRFNNIWAANINSNSSQSFAGQTFFTYEPTDTTITQASVLINPTSPAANGQLLAFGVAGFQKALIDEDGDMVLGYSSLTSAPATDNPLMIYGHNGTNVANITTSGGAYFSGSVGVGTSSPNQELEINGQLRFSGTGAGQIESYASGQYAGMYNYAANNQLTLGTSLTDGTTYSGISLQNNVNVVGLSGNQIFTKIIPTYAPTSGTGTFVTLAVNPTINQTGGANGATRGIYINPTLTSAANWRAIEVVNGNSLFGTTSGSVGIGTASPGTPLEVALNNADTSTNANLLTLTHTSTGTTASGFGEGVLFQLEDTGGSVIGASQIQSVLTGTGTADLRFFTNYASNGLTEKFRLAAQGRLLVGNTAITDYVTEGFAGVITANGYGEFYNKTNNTAADVLKLNNFSAGAPAIGIGSSIHFASDNSNQNPRSQAMISSIYTTITQGSERGALIFKTAQPFNTGATQLVEALRIDGFANVGIGTDSPISRLHVSGKVTGKALGIFDETGDQALFTASASSVPKFTILHNGLVDARIGVATYSKAGTISDTDFTDTAVDGLIGIDTTNHRIYFREGGAWSFAAKAGGFQIPNYEAGGLAVGDYLVPYVESTMEDGAVHGLYAKFSDVKADLFAEVLGTENEKYLGVASQSAETKKSQESLSSRFEEFLSALKETVTAVTGYFKEIFADKTHQKELCVGEEGNETCITKDRLDELLKTLPSPTPTPAPVESSVPTPTPEAVIEASPTATPMPTATDSGQVQ